MSLLASLAMTAQHLVGRYGVVGVFLGMTMESAGIPIPSEVIMPVGAIAAGNVGGVALVSLAGTVGNLVGSAIAYGIGAAIGREWRGSRWLNREHWEAAHRWFERQGDRAVLIGRVLPVIRTYISFPAGAAGMPLGRFLAYTALGSAVWSTALAILGYTLRQNWAVIEPFFHDLTILVILAVLVAVALWLVRRRRP